MKSSDVRQSFIDHFTARGHEQRPSAPLVPHGDPTLLFTNAGMVQFKDLFLGAELPPWPRAVTAQKCMRVSGKHNDLENVGPSPRHHTFFEMLGNFSFGDYFKDEAITFGWDLVTNTWGLPPERLFATVFEEDDEAAALWRKISGLPAERILRRGAKDNFWAMGDTGPCGPCSEIFVDLHPDRPHVDWDEGSENGRYLEIWNLVFMQFDRAADGSVSALPNPSIDTGAGLERVAAVLQGVASNYDTDLFRPLIAAAASLAGREYGAEREADVSMRVIADHLRAVTFLLADGVIPSNEGRGYVLRRVLRRAVRHGMNLGFEEPFLNRLVPVVGEVLGAHYGELAGTADASVATVAAEEQKFFGTVAAASQLVQAAIDAARARGVSVLDGATVFRFYDTHGLPLEVIREIAEEERFGVDEEGFAGALEAQRVRSRSAGQGEKNRVREAGVALSAGGTGEFIGYEKEHLRGDALILEVALELDGEQQGEFTLGPLAAGQSGAVLIKPTPFYAESGGQVGDVGRLTWKSGLARVTDTQKDGAGRHIQFVTVEKGELAANQQVQAAVDTARRFPTQRNHTATHLVHAALREVLGAGVRQAGSLVAPDRLRFDFTYSQPVSADELAQIAAIVNRWVLESQPVETEVKSLSEAKEAGAMALFGEKYGDRVRLVSVVGEKLRSLELCGGCHVANTGQVGPFLIVSERGVASGVRRIEALTGEAALAEIDRRHAALDSAVVELGVADDRLGEEIRGLKGKVRSLELELSQARLQLVSGVEQKDDSVEIEGVRLVAREVPPAPANELRTMADVLRGKLGSAVVVLGSRTVDKVSLIVAVSSDLTGRIAAGKIVAELAPMVGGGGGGRADFAQAGGRRPEQLEATLAAAPEVLRRLLA